MAILDTYVWLAHELAQKYAMIDGVRVPAPLSLTQCVLQDYPNGVPRSRVHPGVVGLLLAINT